MRQLRRQVWPYRVILDIDPKYPRVCTNAETWRSENIPESISFFYGNQLHCYFKQEAHAMFFQLRWA